MPASYETGQITTVVSKAAKLRVGVMGVANIARRSVIPAIKSLPDHFELVAIASRSDEKANDAARAFGCEPFTAYEQLIQSDRIEAVYIPLPTGLHKRWINEALLAGKHVYAEKSIAMNSLDAEEMIANARSRGCALMEGFMFQYHSQHQRVFGLLDDNTIGELRHFAASFGFPPLGLGNFRYDDALGGGALLDAAAYPLRATHFILGDSLEVKAASLHVDAKCRTNIFGSAYLSNRRGLGASIAFGFDNFYQCRYEIWGALGKITATRAFTPGPTFRPQIIVETVDATTVIDCEPDNHFVKAFEEFHRVVREPGLRDKHYSEILLQSRSLDSIRALGSSVPTVG